MNVEDLYRLLRNSHVQAQSIVDTVSDPLLVLDENLRVESASRAFFNTFQVDRFETVGQLLYELGNGQWDIPELRQLLQDVVPRSAALINYKVEHAFPHLGRRVMLLSARTLFHPDKKSHTFLLSIVDATEQHRRDAAKDLLLREIHHRMKNLFAVIASLGRQAPTEGVTAEAFRDAFMGRVGALVEAHELAFSDQDVALPSVITRILAPYPIREGGVEIEDGPAIVLWPQAIQALSLILHELATNAVKYGALSNGEGRIRIGWRRDEEAGLLRLGWQESGGPPVASKPARGYGSQLMEASATQGLGGRVEFGFAPEGLRVEIIAPLGSLDGSS
ncbi:PAS domain-containing protein [Aquabacter sp. L1I39]|uniref:PAS domain-containing sensor histidine kinase n=1 Tax=Aquabacter sp. L1I39 TaxID=2820278 RepID=UPI001ADBCAFF|nr:PAS domain-containing sensor histidine kinase [Aquabacter sp. L1I39]QTL03483.1 PAS domain-containing protein [Aquabacter sp. L1I39]